MIVGLLAPVVPARAAQDAAGGGGGPGSLSAGPAAFFIGAVLAAGSLVVAWRLRVIGPGSPGPRRRVEHLPWFVWLVAALSVFLAMSLGGALVLAVMGPAPAVSEGAAALRRSAAVQWASYAAAVGCAAFLLRALRESADGLRFRPADAPRGLLAFLLAYPVIHTVTGVCVMVAAWVRGGPLPAIAHESLRQIVEHSGSVWAWMVAAGAVLGAPVVEEIIYRVLLQTALLRLIGRAWPAIVATSALFAVVHVGIAEVHALPVLFVLGLSMGVAYERTRSPVVPITMHAAFNLLNVALALWLR